MYMSCVRRQRSLRHLSGCWAVPGSSIFNHSSSWRLATAAAHVQPLCTGSSAGPSAAAPSEGPLRLYQEGVAAGLYRPDPLQEVTVRKLQTLFLELRALYPKPQKPSGLTLVDHVGVKGSKQSWFNGLSTLLQSSSGLAGQPKLGQALPQGLYMYGGVGCGKTMLMDLFVKAAPKEFQVQRTHFHDFMLSIHERLRHTTGEQDPLARVADKVAAHTKVLALDELFVTDVADAMILHRLFGRLWDAGLVLVATSNRAPDALYEGGLQRQLFLPFIQRLKDSCVIHDMASPVDYRRLAHHTGGIYFVSPDRNQQLYEAFEVAAGGVQPNAEVVPVAMGRELRVPQAADGCCAFDFDELCGRPLAAADYIAVANRYHTLALTGVPVFSAANRAAAYRFVTLVDVLYEHRVRLLVSADALPFELFAAVITQQEAQRLGATTSGPTSGAQQAGPGAGHQQRHAGGAGASTGGAPARQQRHAYSGGSSSGGGGPEVAVDDQLGFSKDRTISRLTEMQSLEYLVAHAEQHAPQLLLALREAAEQQQQQQQRQQQGSARW